jgi:predicted nucleic acid-binding protein
VATYLLDSDVIIDALRGRRGRNDLLARLAREGHWLACCPVNVTEVYAGVRAGEEAQTRALLDGLIYCPATREIATRAGLLKRDWAQRGVTLALSDVTVAATALANGFTLITSDRRHYPMPELEVFPLPEA